MKKFTNIFLMTIALLIGACESFVTGINEADITRIQDADLRLVVTAAEINYMGFLEGNAARISGMWSGYFFGFDRQYAGYHTYNMIAGNFNNDWTNIYVYTLKSLRIAQQKAREQGNPSTLGICQVMEASIMGTAISLWGDIPYSEAIDIVQFPNPAYEPQLAVLDKLIPLLDEAIVNLNAGVSAERLGDFLFASNTSWIAAANSTKARLLLYKKDYFNALLAANAGIQIPSNDLNAKHGTSNGVDRNMYNDFLARTRIGMMTAANTFMGALLNSSAPGNRNHGKTNEATRLSRYYSGSSLATYIPNTSSTGYFSIGAAFPLHTAFETKLIAAECLIRLGDFPNALIKLNEHRANLRTVYPTGTYTNFLATDFNPAEIENLNGAVTANDALLREVLEEKYVCLYGQIEAFNEIRRTGNALGMLPNAGTEMPQRFLYAQIEIDANLNVPSPLPGIFTKTALFP